MDSLSSSGALPPPSRWDSLPSHASRCHRYLVRVPNSRIGVVNAILESYEHVARVATADIRLGVLEITVPAEWDEEFQQAAAMIARKIEWSFTKWERDNHEK